MTLPVAPVICVLCLIPSQPVFDEAINASVAWSTQCVEPDRGQRFLRFLGLCFSVWACCVQAVSESMCSIVPGVQCIIGFARMSIY